MLQVWFAVACHPAPAEELVLPLVNDPAPSDGGASCVSGFVLGNRALGETFALHAYQESVREMWLPMAPIDRAAPTSALWRFEAHPSGAATYRIRNLAFSEWVLTSAASVGVALTPIERGAPDQWQIEREAPDSDADGSADADGDSAGAYVLRPTNALGSALAITFAPPYMAQLVPGGKEPGHLWELTPKYHCDDPTTGR
jgi:hypothetical protein